MCVFQSRQRENFCHMCGVYAREQKIKYKKTHVLSTNNIPHNLEGLYCTPSRLGQTHYIRLYNL